jgi:hypothetical protein
MKTANFNKDNVGTTFLLGAFLFIIGAAIFSTTQAAAANTAKLETPTHVEKIVVTATRLK